jgi:hypothetical protein
MNLQQNPVAGRFAKPGRGVLAGIAAFGTVFGVGADLASAGYRPAFSAPVYRPMPVFSAPVYRPAPVFSPPVYRPAPVFSAPAYRPTPRPFVAPVIRPQLQPLHTMASRPIARPAVQVPYRPQLTTVGQPSLRPLVSHGPSAITKTQASSVAAPIFKTPQPATAYSAAAAVAKAPAIVTTAAQSTPSVAHGSSQIAKIGSAASQALNSKPVGIAGNAITTGMGNVASNAGAFATEIAGNKALSKTAISNLNKASVAAEGTSLVADGVKIYAAYKTGGPGTVDKLLASGSEASGVIAVKAAEFVGGSLGGPQGAVTAGVATQVIVDSAKTYAAPVVAEQLYQAGRYPGAAADSKYLQQSSAQIAQMEARLAAERTPTGSRPAAATSILSMAGASRPLTTDDFTRIVLK